MIKAIIFDLDNTLIDFMRMKKMSVSGAIYAMKDAGLDIPEKKAETILYGLYDIHGLEYQKIFQDFLKKQYGKIDYKILASAITGYRKVESGFTKPYPKTLSTLISLKEKNITLAILTDAPRLRAWLRLSETGLADFFDKVICYEDTKSRKPDPKPFRKMLKSLTCSPHEILMVGDSLDKDIKGAKPFKIKTCYSIYGDISNNKKKSKKYSPDYTIKKIEDIIKIIEKENCLS